MDEPRRLAVVLPTLYPYQEAMYLAEAKEAAVVAATQIGKTHGIATWAFARRAALHGSPGIWAAPTDYQLTPGFRTFKRLAESSRLLKRATESKGSREIELINGSIEHFRSWEREDNLLGPTAFDVVADQAEELTEKADANLSSRRSATLGPIRYSGNAGLMTGAFWKTCQRIEEEAKRGLAFFQHLTWRDRAAVLPPADRAEYESFIARERVRLGEEEFGRLYEARFLKLGSGILDFSRIAINGGSAVEPVSLPYREPWEPREQCIAGLDLGQEQDWTVLTVWGRETGRLKAMDRYKTISWEAQIARAVAILESYSSKPDPNANPFAMTGDQGQTLFLYFDATGLGHAVREIIFRQVAEKPIVAIGIEFTNPLKASMIQYLQTDIENKRRSMPWIAELISEAQTLQRKKSGTLAKYEHADGCNDDAVWSAGLAFYGMNHVVRA